MRRQLMVAVSALVCASVACAAGGGGTENSADFSTADAGDDACSECDAAPARDAAAQQEASAQPEASAPLEACGDGRVSRAEACDDGNRRGGDGCAADCLSIEAGYACQPAGSACRRIARCGDGLLSASEQCDDQNREDGDGCSAHCKLEAGHKCDGEPSSCAQTSCGDGQREGTESCDDGNLLPFDGCSGSCQSEPACIGGAACTSSCGDGLVLNEACDDGNLKDGDGCSARCEVEPGFRCAADASCGAPDGGCTLRVPVIYRDFNASHPDFEISCGGLTTGIVLPVLDDEGKPALRSRTGACIDSPNSFAEWYRSSPNNATIPSTLVLYADGKGGFVNRYGAHGEPWLGPADSGPQSFDGNPLFFPIDDSPLALDDRRWWAKIPEQYGYADWPWEDSVVAGAHKHNFHFTTEVVYWFRYDAAQQPTLEFLGDDDVWVFINAVLAVDLGGAHVPEAGSVTLDAASARRFFLEDGRVYAIRVFHAERKVEGSSFKLTLRDFDSGASQCAPICGDGMVTAGEECDDGMNDGGYEECAPGCVLGPSCGDGTLQEGEDCDDGNRIDGDGCGSACRNLILL